MTCIANEQFALNTKLTNAAIKDQNIVVLKADMTNTAPEIEDTLLEFGNTINAIPYYAVYRPGEEPHHFDGNFSTGGAKEFLDTAGISYSENISSGQVKREGNSKADADAVADARIVPAG